MALAPGCKSRHALTSEARPLLSDSTHRHPIVHPQPLQTRTPSLSPIRFQAKPVRGPGRRTSTRRLIEAQTRSFEINPLGLTPPGVGWHCIALGKPMKNRLLESCHSMRHARAVLSSWRRDYNQERSHSHLSWMTPAEYRRQLPTAGRGAALRQSSAPQQVANPVHEGSNQTPTLASV